MNFGLDGGFIAADSGLGQIVRSTPILSRAYEGGDIQRSMTSGNTPVRENLEAEASVLIPSDTPLVNRTKRVPGSGVAAKWNQLASFGGGWPTGTDQGGSSAPAQAFYAETGAPAFVDSVYVPKLAAYKCLGNLGGVSNFAMATSKSYFGNLLAKEKTNKLKNIKLIEEFSLINGSSTATTAPFGDGTNALGFDGLLNLISTANGTPSAQVQTAVGALTTAHLDAQLTRIWKQGARGLYMLMNAQEATSLATIAEKAGGVYRVGIDNQGRAVLGLSVAAYTHPVSGEKVDIIVSRFMPAGTIVFACDYLPEGQNAFEVSVLPQTELPEDAFDYASGGIQGYTARDIAPTIQAPDMFNFMVSVYEVPVMHSALHFAISKGVTPAV